MDLMGRPATPLGQAIQAAYIEKLLVESIATELAKLYLTGEIPADLYSMGKEAYGKWAKGQAVRAESLAAWKKVEMLEPRLAKASALGAELRAKRHPRRDWFDTLLFFIPNSLSEPWVGDIREKRQIMASQGYRQHIIEWATAIDLLILMLFWIKENLRDILTPFKDRHGR